MSSAAKTPLTEIETWECAPTLNDTEIMEMCANGYLVLEAVVPDEINRKVLDFLSGDIAVDYEPTELLDEDWFIEHIILNPQAAGAIRSLLGNNFHLPMLISNHRAECPQEAQNWHVDGASKWSPELDGLQVFYYPQDTPVTMGPTEVVPGSHLVKNGSRAMKHYGRVRSAVLTDAPAGTIFLTIYNIWHRRATATGKGLRHLLKYFYWRTSTPRRDWIREDINYHRANFGGPAGALGESFSSDFSACEMYCWLCGKHDAFEFKGGQCWPLQANRKDGPFWGYPKKLEDA